MGRFQVAAALALAFSSSVQAGVEVTATGDRVDVTASQAPVSEVLDGLARKTRMKVVYEGPAPRMPVTLELRGRTPAQAVLGVLEGLGLNYALVLDLSGTEVETLMIVGADTRAASAGSVRPPPTARRDAPHANPEDPEVESDEPPPEVAQETTIAPAAPEAPKAEEAAKPAPVNARPAPVFVDPLNPSKAFPYSPPFAPGPPLVMPSPSPNPPPSS